MNFDLLTDKKMLARVVSKSATDLRKENDWMAVNNIYMYINFKEKLPLLL